MSDLVSHLEARLGPMRGGWRDDVDPESGLQVAGFGQDVPFAGVTTLVTLGLSNTHLEGGHQELLMHLPVGMGDMGPALLDFARKLKASGRVLLRGEYVRLGEGFLGTGEMSGLLAYSPVYLPDGFGTCDLGDRTIIIAWLIPITPAEERFVDTHGWHALETAFATEDPDLTDPNRPTVAAAH
ncbi:suppressor of fused domain protein [Amycolatopsis sp. NPDC059657]|uniref:suppressor of fused domain protein n=1 Tax=Amycolatopsis sp. NPDC059657 TaxID=3346899 RepID=UPI0036726D70